jgi:hypothetical protein
MTATMTAEELGEILDSDPDNTAVTTWGNRAFDIFEPSTWTFDIDEIAKALGNTCRFGGHVDFYSVAEHSVRVSRYMRDQGWNYRAQMIGLLHDATETYIGDIMRPMKKAMRVGDMTVEELEHNINLFLMASFNLLSDSFEHTWKDGVKHADMQVYLQERSERPSPGEGMLPEEATQEFLNRFYYLWYLLEEGRN